MGQPTGVALRFKAFYTKLGLGVSGLTVTVDVYKRGASNSLAVTAGAATDIGGGFYEYVAASGIDTQVGDYLSVFKTTGDVDQQHLPGLQEVNAWVDQIVSRLDVAISTRLATAGYTVPPTAAVIAAAAFDLPISGHTTAGTTGKALSDASVDPMGRTVPGVYGAGTAGLAIGTTKTNVDTITPRVDLAVSTRASQTSVDTIGTKVDVAVSTRASQASVDPIATKVDVAVSTRASQASLDALDVDVSGLASQVSVDAIAADVDVPVSSRASQVSVDAVGSAVDVPVSSRSSQTSVDDLAAVVAAIDPASPDVIADAVLDELLAEHELAGSVGEALGLLDDIQADTSIIVNRIAVGGVTVVSPFDPVSGRLTLVRGDDYPAGLPGEIPAFESSDWPDLTGAQEIRLTIRDRPVPPATGDPVLLTLLDSEPLRMVGTGDQAVTFEPLHAPGDPVLHEQEGGTDNLIPGLAHGSWDVQATLQDGTIKTLALGLVDVRADVTRDDA